MIPTNHDSYERRARKEWLSGTEVSFERGVGMSKRTSETAVGSAIARWRAAMRWRQQADAELVKVGLTLTQWLVLDAIIALFKEAADAVSQMQIAERAKIDKMTVSQVLRNLEGRGLVSRGPDLTGPAKSRYCYVDRHTCSSRRPKVY